jgi:hypothetical protein
VPSRRDGSEPVTARSALRLRTWLAAFGVLASTVAAAWLANEAGGREGSARTALTVLAIVAVLGAAVGVVDLVVLVRRRRTAGPGG